MEKAWELAVVSGDRADPFVFSWSAKHTRLSFQMFISSLLAMTAAKFEIKSLNFFGMISFQEAPEKEVASIIILLFAAYSLFCFLVRSKYEQPILNEEAKRYRKTLANVQNGFRSTRRELLKIARKEKYQNFLNGNQFDYLPDSPEANVDLPNLASELYLIMRKWAQSSFGYSGVIWGKMDAIPGKYKIFKRASSHSTDKKIRAILCKIEEHEIGRSADDLYASLDDFLEHSFSVKDLTESDFIESSKFIRSQEFEVFRNRLRFWNGLLMRYLDVYLLPVFLPAIVSAAFIFFAIKEIL